MKLHVFPPSPRAFKVLAVANYLELKFEACPVDFAKGGNRTPEYTALNPNQRMPTLEDDGFVLWESNAIIQYLSSKKPEAGLLPGDARGRADVSRWQFWESAHWDPACAILLFERVIKKAFGRGDADPAEVEKGLERFHRAAGVLDSQLKGREFVMGNQITLADFSLGPAINLAQVAQLPLENYPQIRRWHATLWKIPSWKNTFVPLS